VVSQHQYGTCTKCQEIKVKNSDGCPLGGIGWSEMKKDLGSIKKKNAFLFSFLFSSQRARPVTQRPASVAYTLFFTLLGGPNQLAGRCIFRSQLSEYFIKVGAHSQRTRGRQ
jgi:hypothetical protein